MLFEEKNSQRTKTSFTFLRVCAQLNPTLCNPMAYSLPGFSVHGILQARILEWVAITFSRASPNPRIKLGSLVSPALAGGFFATESPGKPQKSPWCFLNFQIAKVRSFKMEVILGKSTRKKKKRKNSADEGSILGFCSH